MKICIIGNSHVAALKSAADQAAARKPALDFFAAPNSIFGRARFRTEFASVVSDDVQVLKHFSTTSNDHDGRIDVPRYDRFLMCGQPATYFQALLCEVADADFYEPGVHKHLLAKRLFQTYLIERKIHKAGLALMLALLDLKKPKADVCVVPAPALTRAQFEKRFPRLKAPTNLLAATHYADSLLDQWLTKKGARYLRQPLVTLDNAGFTKPEYGADDTHMNAAYGALVLEIARTPALSATPPALSQA